MKKLLISLLITLSFTIIKAQKLQEINDIQYRSLAQTGVAFVNFNKPTCDLAEYYNVQIEELNRYIKDIPIYFFDKSKYPEIEKEFQLWGASKLCLIRNGVFVSEYEGIHGLNNRAKWIVDTWNSDHGTHISLPETRFTPTMQTTEQDIERYKVFDFRFDGNGIDKISGLEKFIAPIGNIEYENNCLKSMGLYNRETNSFTRTESSLTRHNFSVFFEFMPFSTGQNTLLVGDRGSRFFEIGIIKNKLCISFSNSEWCYPLDETELQAYNWNAIAASYNDAQHKFEIVLNGKQLRGIQVNPSVIITASTATFGLCDFGGGNVYNGYINNLRLYNKALQNGDLMNMYQSQRTHFPDMSAYMPKNKIADFDFSSNKNSVSQTEDFLVKSNVSSISNGVLELVTSVKDSYPSINTKKLKGFDPNNYTIYFEMMPSTLGEHNFQFFTGLRDGYSRLLTIKTLGNEIKLELKTPEKIEILETKGANLTINKWQSFILSINKANRTVLVGIDGNIVLNRTFDDDSAFELMNDNVHITFSDFGNPHTYSGKVDNLKVFRKAANSIEINTLYNNRGESF